MICRGTRTGHLRCFPALFVRKLDSWTALNVRTTVPCRAVCRNASTPNRGHYNVRLAMQMRHCSCKCILNLSRICCVRGKSHCAHAILSHQLLAELFALWSPEWVLHRGDVAADGSEGLGDASAHCARASARDQCN